MFGNSNRDKEARFDAMIDQARHSCNFNQPAMFKHVAKQMENFRDFDDIADKERWVRRNYERRMRGAAPEFEEKYEPQRGPGSAY